MKKVVWLVVAAVLGIAVAIFLMPQSDPVTVDKPDLVAATPDQAEVPAFEVEQPVKTPEPAQEKDDHPSAMVNTGDRPAGDGPGITEGLGLTRGAGPPLDRHAQIDSAKWLGVWRMLKKDGESALTDAVKDMAETVKTISDDNEASAYASLFENERALILQIRSATDDEQVHKNLDDIEKAIKAVESGDTHPVDVALLGSE